MKKEMQELTEGMQRLCAVANRVVASQEKASRIEVDLLLENLRRLYDIALRLAGEGTESEAEAEAAVPAATIAAPAAPMEEMAKVSTMAAMACEEVKREEVKNEKVEEEKAGSLDEDGGNGVEAVAPAAATAPQPAGEVATPVAPAEPPVVEMPSVEELEDNGNALLFDEVVIDKGADETKGRVEDNGGAASQPSLLDYLGQTSQRTLGESLATAAPLQNALEKKVDDLRTVININDKFSFMSELFKGNMKAYNDFIMRLNATAGREEALAHVADVAAQYKWDDASPAVKTFYKIFDKKF